MSWATWKKLYYPKAAGTQWARQHPTAHALQKWRGLDKKTLKQHGLYREGARLYSRRTDRQVFCVGADTCAYCKIHATSCQGCPLYRLLFDHCCDYVGLLDLRGPYAVFVREGTTDAMLALLELAAKEYPDAG